jgi:alpha-beta hydrolase superfamily lysophospholipase
MCVEGVVRQEEGRFAGLGGLGIYWQSWLPDGAPLAVLLLAHGYAEHSGRYGNLVDYFVPRGHAIYAIDHRGHGRSDGERVQVDSYDDYLVDLKTFHDRVRAEQPSVKLFLVGHSMGAAIATAYTARHQAELDGLVLSGGGIATENAPVRPASLALADTLSTDPAVIEAYKNDPLVYHGPPPPARTNALAQMRDRLRGDAAAIRIPILVLAGAASPLGDGPRSQALYDVVGSPDKTLKLYGGLMHEIFNEPQHRAIMADMEAWLDAHR